MPITLDGTLGITTPTYGGADTAEYLVPVTGFKNRIINGAMMIDQRNAGASKTISSTADFTYTLDRFSAYGTVGSKFSVQQNAGSVTPPVGFTNYLGVTSLATTSLAAADNYTIRQNIEGFNIADLAWGTANAAAVKLSFLVRSSLTGAFGGAIINSAYTRSYPFSYTISAANTWTQITVTIPGDTSGTWLTNNGVGLQVVWGLGVGTTYSGTAGAWAGSFYYVPTGSVSIVGTNGATFFITGVQLEKGTTATSFDYRPYGTELALCQRYFTSYGGSNLYEIFGGGQAANTTITVLSMQLPVEMRSAPTLGYNSVGAFLVNDSSVQNASSSLTIDGAGVKSLGIQITTTGLTQGRATRILANNSLAARITFSSEL